MKAQTKELIKQVAKFIDKDKYNPLLLRGDYAKYLEDVLTEMVRTAIKMEKFNEQ